MWNFFQAVGQIAVAGILALAATVGGVLTQPRVVDIVPQTAVVSDSANLTFFSATSSSPTPEAAPPVKISNPTSSPEAAPPPPPPAPKTATTTITVPPVKKVAALKPAPPPLPTAPQFLAVNAQTLLDATVLSLRPQIGGAYTVVLKTTINGVNLSWSLHSATLGGTNGIPVFNVDYSCDPQPLIPGSDSLDQNPSFSVRSSYKCQISLTPTEGADRRAVSKEFDFKTDGGQLFVSLSPTIDTLLRDDKNSGGFVFNNQDSLPVTITSVKVDAYYANLNVSSLPLVLRFIDPSTETTLADYNLGNIPENSGQYTHSQTGIDVPISFYLAPNSQKMLAVQMVGVRKMILANQDPIIKITLTDVSPDNSDAKVSISSPQIVWTCIATTAAYDPNATSGPYATGQVCKD